MAHGDGSFGGRGADHTGAADEQHLQPSPGRRGDDWGGAGHHPQSSTGPTPGNELFQPDEGRFVQLDVERAKRGVQLLLGAETDVRCGDSGLRQPPRQ